ncbi:hypothetical protein BC829DRAFT_454477, partial [Chytridium lagenaria]
GEVDAPFGASTSSKKQKRVDTSIQEAEIARVASILSSPPEDLPGREDEFGSLYTYLSSSVEQNTGDCIYVSGVPGTGKTASLRSVIATMRQSVNEETLPDFEYFEINCMKLIEPAQAYCELWSYISPHSGKVGAKKAAELLSDYFKKKPKGKGKGKAKPIERKPIILLLDELDMLVTKKQEVIYNFF